jgi:hypothetical protein
MPSPRLRAGNRPDRTTTACSASVWKKTSKWIFSRPTGAPASSALPDTEAEAEALLKTCAQRAVAASRKRKSILSIDTGRLQLHRAVRLDGLAPDMLARIASDEARAFLNDLAWWQAQTGSKPGQAAAPSPFSLSGFGGSWSPGR